MKKCIKCGTTEKKCPDFYETEDTKEDICGNCYGILEDEC